MNIDHTDSDQPTNQQPQQPQNQPRTWVTNGLIYNGKTKDLQKGSILIVDDAIEKVVFDDDKSYRSVGSIGKEFSGGDCGLSKLREKLTKCTNLNEMSSMRYDQGLRSSLKIRRGSSDFLEKDEDDNSSEMEIDPDSDTIVDAKGKVVTPAFIFRQCRVPMSRSNSLTDLKESKTSHESTGGAAAAEDDNAAASASLPGSLGSVSRCASTLTHVTSSATLVTSHHEIKSRMQESDRQIAARKKAQDYLVYQTHNNGKRLSKSRAIIPDPSALERFDNLYTIAGLLTLAYIFVFIAADATDLFFTTDAITGVAEGLRGICLFDCVALAMLLVLCAGIGWKIFRVGLSACVIRPGESDR